MRKYTLQEFGTNSPEKGTLYWTLDHQYCLRFDFCTDLWVIRRSVLEFGIRASTPKKVISKFNSYLKKSKE